ncbi:MAG TPA: hypothetical protein VGM14_30315 [Streptosporangiaceae bacterium]
MEDTHPGRGTPVAEDTAGAVVVGIAVDAEMSPALVPASISVTGMPVSCPARLIAGRR